MLSPLIEVNSPGRHEDFSTEFEPGGIQSRGKDRTDAGCFQFAQDLAILSHSSLFKFEYVGEHHNITFHTNHLGDGGHFPGAILQARLLDDEVHCRGDLLAHHF